MGESMGGGLAILVGLQNQYDKGFRGAILICPMIEVDLPP